MIKKDLLHRFIFEKAPIRGEFIHLEQTFQTIIAQHNYPASLKRLLGEALAVAGLLSAIIKFDGKLTVQFRGKGKLKLLLAQCDSQFNMRALVKWDEDLTYSDLMGAFQDGTLSIILDPGLNKNRYQGIVAWRGNSLTESIEGYFRESEQLATKIWLAVDEVSAVGFLLQATPVPEKDQSPLEKTSIQSHWELITNLSGKLSADLLLHTDYEDLLEKFYPDEEIRIFAPVAVMFDCSCSRKRGEDAILLLGRKEAEEELAQHQNIAVTCDFCNKEYIFSRHEVEEIFAKDENPSTDILLN